MSPINRTDVKKHLSPRHRTEIHLYRPDHQPGDAPAVEENSAPLINDAAETPLDPTPATTPTSTRNTAPGLGMAIVAAPSKSAKA